ncbi:unnamed protein product [Periconia digitata]|uniref:Uncharacterized protein n=1 Tax=Periconia digitata TaxID=1303443 RepID=A0A9W4UR46_9PLEO|nr:unnamed protein product [Periconia digitata]
MYVRTYVCTHSQAQSYDSVPTRVRSINIMHTAPCTEPSTYIPTSLHTYAHGITRYYAGRIASSTCSCTPAAVIQPALPHPLDNHTSIHPAKYLHNSMCSLYMYMVTYINCRACCISSWGQRQPVGRSLSGQSNYSIYLKEQLCEGAGLRSYMSMSIPTQVHMYVHLYPPGTCQAGAKCANNISIEVESTICRARWINARLPSAHPSPYTVIVHQYHHSYIMRPQWMSSTCTWYWLISIIQFASTMNQQAERATVDPWVYIVKQDGG